MKTIRLLSLLLLSVHALASAAPVTPILETQGMLRDAAGRSLYVYARDQAGTSNCTADCNKSWPAYIAATGAKPGAELSLVTRANGDLQWAYHGQALYFFAGDRQAGDANGEGVGGVWHAARTTPAAPSPASSYGYGY